MTFPTSVGFAETSEFMAAPQTLARRLIAAGGLAVAVVGAPIMGAFTVGAPPPALSAAECAPGEEVDSFTGKCLPFAVPNSPRVFTTIPGNPNVPALDTGTSSIPCPIPQNCIGLGESRATGPSVGAPPESSVGGSPTVTGQVG